MAPKLTFNEVDDYITSQNCEWIDGFYENNASKLSIKFTCGCIGLLSFCNFRNGRRCYTHQRILAAKSRRVSIERMIEEISDSGFIYQGIIGEENGRKTILLYSCQFGHLTKRYYKDFYAHPNCAECMINKSKLQFRFSENELFEIIQENNCKLLEIFNYENRKNSSLKIEFSCGHVETLSMRNFQGRKTGLCVECEMESRSGETAYGWKGGITPISNYIRRELKEWNSFCAKYYNYKCVITGQPMEHIHHLQSFNLLLKETLDSLNIELGRKTIGDYSEDELSFILNKFIEIQNNYPIGVPLISTVHVLFHKFYGRGNNTPDQFYEFVDKINSGEIQIP